MEENKEQEKVNHGNTRLPFGLCKRYGINLPDDATPRDAWDALAGKGITREKVYSALKKSGSTQGLKAEKSEGTQTQKTYKQAKYISESKTDKYGFYTSYKQEKDKNPEKMVFTRVGDYYEAYGDDAITASKQAELTLGGRAISDKERTPMVGFPFNRKEQYLAKLKKAGNDVVILDNGKKYEQTAEQKETTAVEKAQTERLKQVPDGWKEIKNAPTAPAGYKWYSNGKSRFDKEYKSALVLTDSKAMYEKAKSNINKAIRENDKAKAFSYLKEFAKSEGGDDDFTRLSALYYKAFK